MYIQIALVILVLASFVIAYFSARTWHWGYVLVMLGIFLSAVGYFILAAETLRIYAITRQEYNERERRLGEVQAKLDALTEGTSDGQLIGQLAADEIRLAEEAEELPALRELEHQLNMLTRLRGRVWEDVTPVGADPQSGIARAEVPQPGGLAQGVIVYAFEAGEPALPDPTQGAQYLGQFRVQQVAGNVATLEPVLEQDEYERGRLAASRARWVLYETMPADQHRIFAELSEEELRQRIPPESLPEYLRHGEEAGPDDDQWHRVGFDAEGNQLGPDEMDQAARVLYRRRLRDYALELEGLARQRVIMLADIDAVQADNERLRTALASAQQLQAFREDELRRLQIDLAGVTRERETIEAHLAQVERQLATARALLAETIARNSQLAQQLAALQAEISEGIDGASTAEPVGPLALGGAG